jgi:hypothetical protein
MNQIVGAFVYAMTLLAGAASEIPGLKKDPEFGPSLDPEWFMPPVAEALRARPWVAAVFLMLIALIAWCTFRAEK